MSILMSQYEQVQAHELLGLLVWHLKAGSCPGCAVQMLCCASCQFSYASQHTLMKGRLWIVCLSSPDQGSLLENRERAKSGLNEGDMQLDTAWSCKQKNVKNYYTFTESQNNRIS